MQDPLQRLPPQPRGEEEQECSQLLPQMEQIARHALCRTQRWKTPPGYETAYWNEERESIARIAVWNACLSYKPNTNVSFPAYAFFKAVQAIRQEHRHAWRWGTNTMPLPYDVLTGELMDMVDPEWQEPFRRCEEDCDLQTLLQSLSESERQMLHWCYQEGLTEREIACRLNLSKTAVHKRLVKAKSKLEKALSQREHKG